MHIWTFFFKDIHTICTGFLPSFFNSNAIVCECLGQVGTNILGELDIISILESYGGQMSIIITAFRHTISVTKTSSNTYTVIETLEDNPLHNTAFSVTCTSMEELLNLLDAYFQEKARRYQGGCE